MTSRERKRKRRMHRSAAIQLLREVGFFNSPSSNYRYHTTLGSVAKWHLEQARRV